MRNKTYLKQHSKNDWFGNSWSRDASFFEELRPITDPETAISERLATTQCRTLVIGDCHWIFMSGNNQLLVQLRRGSSFYLVEGRYCAVQFRCDIRMMWRGERQRSARKCAFTLIVVTLSLTENSECLLGRLGLPTVAQQLFSW